MFSTGSDMLELVLRLSLEMSLEHEANSVSLAQPLLSQFGWDEF
jgi:hypothetical protein